MSGWFDFDFDLAKVEESVNGLASTFSKQINEASKVLEGVQVSLLEKADEASKELGQEKAKLHAEHAREKAVMNGKSDLPWETDDESLAILSQDLMEQVMELSLCDDNFTQPIESEKVANLPFDFEACIPVIMRILELDSNLAAIHAKLSPKMDEIEFWKNYFLRVKYLRAHIGMDGKEAQNSIGAEPHEIIIMRFRGNVANLNSRNGKENELANEEEETLVFSDRDKYDADEQGQQGEYYADDNAKGNNNNKNTRAKRLEQAALAAEVEAELLNDEGEGYVDVDLDNLDLDLDDLELDEEDLNDLSDISAGDLAAEDSMLDASIARELDAELKDVDEDENENATGLQVKEVEEEVEVDLDDLSD